MITNEEMDDRERAFHNALVAFAVDIAGRGHIPAYLVISRGTNGPIGVTGNVKGVKFIELVLQEALQYVRDNPELSIVQEQCDHGKDMHRCDVPNCPSFKGHIE